MLHIRRFSSLTRAQTCTCPPDGFCIAPATIAYAKVSGADSIARADTIASDTGNYMKLSLSGHNIGQNVYTVCWSSQICLDKNYVECRCSVNRAPELG